MATSKSKLHSGQAQPAFIPSQDLKPYGAAYLLRIKLPKQKKHWGEVVQKGQLGMIAGPRGTGKTFLVIALALSMVNKVKFLGRVGGGKRRVILIDAEMGLRAMQQRLEMIAESLDVKLTDDLQVINPELFDGVLPSLSGSEGQAAIDKAIGTDWDVMIIDNYSAWSDTGREDAESWQPWLKWMLAHKRAGRTIIVVHHTGKNGVQRGSSKHEDALDFSILLKSRGGSAGNDALHFDLELTKSRHLAQSKIAPITVTMALHGDRYVWEYAAVETDEDRIAKAHKLRDEGKSNASIAKILGVDRSTVGRWFRK